MMDSADGLAVQNPQRRLVMADSAGCIWGNGGDRTRAHQNSCLTDLDSYRWLALMAASGWGRWGNKWRSHSNLRPDGKGAFHKAAIRSP